MNIHPKPIRLPAGFEALYPAFNAILTTIKHLRVEGDTLMIDESVSLPGQTVSDILSNLTETDIPSTIARDTEVAAAVAAHVAAADPHPGYLTLTEGDARYRELTDLVTYTEITGKPAALALLFSGTGSPESVVTAGIGSLFLRTDGGASTALYVKESGVGTNTGWIGK